MVAYVISLNDVTDPDAFDRYAAVARRITPLHGGRVIARGPGVALESDDVPDRVLVIEFDSEEAATAFYASAEYETARSLRAGAGRVRLLLVPGLPQ